MGLKHNKRPFTGDESYQFTYKHSRQVDCSCQQSTFVEFSPYRNISELPPTSVEEILNRCQGEESSGGQLIKELSLTADKDFESNRYTVSRLSNDPVSASSTSRNDENSAMSEHGKSSSNNDIRFQLACNHSREVDQSSKLASSVEDLPLNDMLLKRSTPGGEGGQVLNQSQGDEKQLSSTNNNQELDNRSIFLTDCAVNASIGLSGLAWLTSGNSKDDMRSELPVRISFSPRFAENDLRSTVLIPPEEIYSSFIDCLPRRLVAIGPNHQADVPVWSPRDDTESSIKLDSINDFDHVTYGDDSEKWIGTCITPMPDVNAVYPDGSGVGCRAECGCPDEGSIRCVRLHVMEAREKLKQTLGQDLFMTLGFSDMGEDVAKRWSEEEQQVFHEVVFANPASMGKNFWEHLPLVFPDRNYKDFVSYYFNVFMLRRRAEQNRSDPSNVDSDNDELQDSYDAGFVMEDYEEDSVVESPVGHEDLSNNYDSHGEDFHEEDEGVDDDDDDEVGCPLVDEENEEGLFVFSKGCINNNHVQMPLPEGKNLHDGVDDQDVQDDSCTSYEGQHHGPDVNGGPTDIAATEESVVDDNRKFHPEYRNAGASSLTVPMYISSPSKTWDLSYFPRPGKGIDFLPTCNVIEEVFGKGAWDNEAKDGQGIS